MPVHTSPCLLPSCPRQRPNDCLLPSGLSAVDCPGGGKKCCGTAELCQIEGGNPVCCPQGVHILTGCINMCLLHSHQNTLHASGRTILTPRLLLQASGRETTPPPPSRNAARAARCQVSVANSAAGYLLLQQPLLTVGAVGTIVCPTHVTHIMAWRRTQQHEQMNRNEQTNAPGRATGRRVGIKGMSGP